MRLINTNLLNYFYKNGVKPLKDSLTKKLDASKGANNLLTTEAGFWLDARQGKELKRLIDEQNSNLSELSGSLANIKYKYKDISIAIPANGVLGTQAVSDAKVILSASILYNDYFYHSQAIASINQNVVCIRCNQYPSAMTIYVRVVYI